MMNAGEQGNVLYLDEEVTLSGLTKPDRRLHASPLSGQTRSAYTVRRMVFVAMMAQAGENSRERFG
jgi:hypothetical protein